MNHSEREKWARRVLDEMTPQERTAIIARRRLRRTDDHLPVTIAGRVVRSIAPRLRCLTAVDPLQQNPTPFDLYMKAVYQKPLPVDNGDIGEAL